VEYLHEFGVRERRSNVLAREVGACLPLNSTVLDVGCGDGLIASLISAKRPDLSFHGIDVLRRQNSFIPVDLFDGETIPFADQSFDVVMFVDVLHHTADPLPLLVEARRIARHSIVIKDHYCRSEWDRRTLKLMDNVGNSRFGVSLPFNYLSPQEWQRLFSGLSLAEAQISNRIGLYPGPLNLIFGRGLHFVTRLNVPSGTSSAPGLTATRREVLA
jgi:SAM-dependent methyltransferase